MDRRELAGFLRSRRERIKPAAAGPRRRTPGLRREEVAHLAHISVEYYTRLEQARAPRPSPEVLAGLARALRLSDAERDHLHHLAGASPTPPPGLCREVRPSILEMIRRLPLSAAFVTSAAYDVLVWNDLAAALMEDFSAVPPRDRNIARRAFLGPGLYGVSDAPEFARSATRQLRAVVARYPDDAGLRTLIDDLLAGSAGFRTLWASHDVAARPTLRKTFRHPLVGPVTVNCDALDVADSDQRVVIYTADPGSPSEAALLRLALTSTTSSTQTGAPDGSAGTPTAVVV